LGCLGSCMLGSENIRRALAPLPNNKGREGKIAQAEGGGYTQHQPKGKESNWPDLLARINERPAEGRGESTTGMFLALDFDAENPYGKSNHHKNQPPNRGEGLKKKTRGLPEGPNDTSKSMRVS